MTTLSIELDPIAVAVKVRLADLGQGLIGWMLLHVGCNQRYDLAMSNGGVWKYALVFFSDSTVDRLDK